MSVGALPDLKVLPPGETLTQLLTWLDQAIERGWIEEVYTDEINPPASYRFRAGNSKR
jgi:hypothetical protein